MDIYDPLAARTRPASATAETQAPRTTAASAYRATGYQTPQTQTQTQTQTQDQGQQQQPPPPSPAPGDTSMPEQTTPTPLAPAPCPACATPSHWPWIIALLVGGGLGWYVGSRKKSRS